MRSSDVVVELPLVNVILYLIFKFMKIVGVMPHVTVIATIFVLVHLYYLIPYGEEPSKVDLPFFSLKHFSSSI